MKQPIVASAIPGLSAYPSKRIAGWADVPDVEPISLPACALLAKATVKACMGNRDPIGKSGR